MVDARSRTARAQDDPPYPVHTTATGCLPALLAHRRLIDTWYLVTPEKGIIFLVAISGILQGVNNCTPYVRTYIRTYLKRDLYFRGDLFSCERPTFTVDNPRLPSHFGDEFT